MNVKKGLAKTWSPAVPIYQPDNIISSDYVNKKKFIPSYEKEGRPCIEQLVTNEYQRMWWEERNTWLKMRKRTNDAPKIMLRVPIASVTVKKQQPSRMATSSRNGVKCKEDIKVFANEKKTKQDSTLI